MGGLRQRSGDVILAKKAVGERNRHSGGVAVLLKIRFTAFEFSNTWLMSTKTTLSYFGMHK